MFKSIIKSVANKNLLIDAHSLEWFSSISTVADADFDKAVSLDASKRADSSYDFWNVPDWIKAYRPYNVQNGILHIPVRGSLLNHFPWAYGSYATGYEYIYEAVKRGVSDDSVIGIILNINSPGGLVDGCFELCDYIYEQRSLKPITAVCDSYAYSAAYALASSATSITVPKTGGVGSVGVVCTHMDMSKMLEDWGLKITFIFAGKHKVDGNPYQNLPDDVKSRIQSGVNETYDLFVATVAKNRGIGEDIVRETEAMCLTAKEAEEKGFVDRILYPKEARASFATELDEDVEEGDVTMSTKPENSEAKTSGVDETALTAARQEGATAERSRISAILTAPEAENRSKLANHIAFNTNMSAEDAKGMLSNASEEAKIQPPSADTKAAPNAFEVAMNKSNPEVGADESASELSDEDKVANAFLSSHTKVTGVKHNVK